MGRYRKILVAADGSDSSKNAFRQACKIAREDKSWVSVLTTVPFFHDQFEVLGVKERAGRVLRAEGERILAAIKRIADGEDVYIRTFLEESNPFDTITDFAEEGRFDLVVMGRCGSGVERALVGSCTARVIGHSHRDVLVVPDGTSVGWERALLPADGSRFCEAAVRRAIQLTKAHGGSLTAVTVVDVTEEFQAQAPEAVDRLVKGAWAVLEGVRQKAETSGVAVETLVKERETYQAVTELARERGINVIVMGSHGRTGLRRLLMGSVTEKVIGHAPCPVLVVRS